MLKTETTSYDVAEHLRTKEEMALYLEAAIEEADDDVLFIAKVLNDIARVRGMTQVAQEALSGERTPQFATIMKLSKALGLRWCIQPVTANT